MEEYINLIYSIFIFIIGTLFGSFFTLAIYRIPRKQDIVKTRSYCPNCKHKLGFFDCFPILSYVSTIGRCKYCKRPISIRYPLIELVSGFSFLIIYLVFGFSWQTLALIAAYVYLVLVVGVDIMKAKMTPEEKAEVEAKKKIKKTNDKKKTNNQDKESNRKAGAINIDILVAIIVFVIFFVSTIYVTRNYSATLIEYSRKTEALNMCLNNINNEKAKNFQDIVSHSELVELDGVSYSHTITVENFMKAEGVVMPNVKVITSKVSYLVNNTENNITLKCIKVEDNI